MNETQWDWRGFAYYSYAQQRPQDIKVFLPYCISPYSKGDLGKSAPNEYLKPETQGKLLPTHDYTQYKGTNNTFRYQCDVTELRGCLSLSASSTSYRLPRMNWAHSHLKCDLAPLDGIWETLITHLPQIRPLRRCTSTEGGGTAPSIHPKNRWDLAHQNDMYIYLSPWRWPSPYVLDFLWESEQSVIHKEC